MYDYQNARKDVPTHNSSFLDNIETRTICARVSFDDWIALHDCIVLLGIIAEDFANKGHEKFKQIDDLCCDLYGKLFFNEHKSDTAPLFGGNFYV